MSSNLYQERDSKEAFRYLLLPILPDNEQAAFSKAIEALNANNIAQEDHAAFIKLNYDIWKSEGKLSKTLRTLIEVSLKEGDKIYGGIISSKYLNLHETIKDKLLGFEATSILLSHMRLIAFLASDQKMSSAKISKMIAATDNRLGAISWKVIQRILSEIGMEPILQPENVRSLDAIDAQLEETYFADSNISQASFLVGKIARDLGFPGDLEFYLNKLSNESEAFIPYIQILHYQCLISGFFDHVVSTIYEFNPRGNVALWLFKKYDHLVSTENPFLNNAKAVDTLDINWVRSRKSNIEQASSLVEILKGFDEMGYSTSHELSGWVRRWLHRFIRLQSPAKTKITSLSKTHIVKILRHIEKAQSETYGIIEQRLVDTVTAVLYSDVNWRARGLGDSVNSSNLSKKKLGDCDYQNVHILEIHAYEAHGGKLTEVYYNTHLRTLARALERRTEDLVSISEITNWKIRLFFIAHSFFATTPKVANILGISIEIIFLTFQQFFANNSTLEDELVKSFDLNFTTPLNDRRTPEFAREKVKKILE